MDSIQYIARYLSSFGVGSRILPDGSGAKASLLASIGPTHAGGIVLSAHTDVVPVEGQAWASDPFRLEVREGRAVGRGTTDMKGFIAAVLAHVPHWVRAPLAAPIHLAFSYDEEVGCLGAPDLAAAVAALEPRPRLCIVGEPTGMAVATAHKGKVGWHLEVRGRPGHSALPHRAANAVEATVRIVSTILAFGARYREEGPHDPAFDPPYSTVHVAALHGGDALNFVPDRCEAAFEVRDLPGHDVTADLERMRAAAAAELADMRRRAPESAIRWTELLRYPAFRAPDDPALLDFVRALAGGARPPCTVSFGTEAGIYAAAGIPTFVCGPGDIARAHKADEYITLDELGACGAFFERLTEALVKGLPP